MRGRKCKGERLGEVLFDRKRNSHAGTLVGKHTYEESWDLIRHKDKKVHLHVAEMLEWLDQLSEKAKAVAVEEQAYPFNLMAGERRSYNANGILRNPEWRKKDRIGQLKMNPKDAEALLVHNDDKVRCTSAVGAIEIPVLITDEIPPGVLSMPHGYGFSYAGSDDPDQLGVLPNLLTSLTDCDPLAKTPYHKNVRVRVEKVEELVSA